MCNRYLTLFKDQFCQPAGIGICNEIYYRGRCENGKSSGILINIDPIDGVTCCGDLSYFMEVKIGFSAMDKRLSQLSLLFIKEPDELIRMARLPKPLVYKSQRLLWVLWAFNKF
ncbi:hypothetical protein [Flavihumibacter fluvii]|uniref:hypothetical protein n=1 Tax=Flavihumibacter fluvii TaxID=2838157 RepID=UPI001BDDE4BC|nr:hypothetical protein [Flavihumibacter fluvii]ULQ52596.1 hypothetical protein KJS93_21135 [Flavihumibacter fluvii]